MAVTSAKSQAATVAMPQPGGIDHAALEQDGPSARGDPLGTPAPDETVLWKGRPAVSVLARTAFHACSAGLYMAGLAVVAVMKGNVEAAVVVAVLGVVLVALLCLLAWLSARSTLYILTDARVIMRIGMAIETRINLPLKRIKAAHLRDRGKGYGDIAFEIDGERLLGYVLLWPHVRPWRLAMPQPMLRAVPEAAAVAQLIAAARARHGEIALNLSQLKEGTTSTTHHAPLAAPASARAAVLRCAGDAERLGDKSLRGAPA